MSARPAVVALLQRYDDDSWAALANRGLLRRAHKDLASTSPRIVREDDEGLDVEVDDRTVRLTLAGPGHATCSCPSTSVCQHVIAAGLWLAAEESAAGVGGDAASASDVLHEEVMALDQDALTTAAGKAAYRWAHQFVTDLDRPATITRGAHLGVEFDAPDVRLRYFGGGVAAWVLDQAMPAPEKYRVAAILAWQRAHGLELPALPEVASSRGPTVTQRAQSDSRERLLAAVDTLLADTVRIGISHLSGAVLDRFTTSAVWAQGAELPRLALLLRRLADQVELLLLRRSSADDLRLLGDLAVAHALVAALRVAPAAHLVGRARNTYDPVRELQVVGLGSLPWRTGSGYQGLTTVFWEAGRERFLTWTDARPTTLNSFDPRARFHQAAPWPGLASPQEAAGRRIRLTNARLSPDGRLSGVESTSAMVSEIDADQWQRVVEGGATSWAELARERAGAGQSLLAAPKPASAWAVLRPTSTGRVVFDQVRQTLVWPLVDAAGDLLMLELGWADHLAHAIDRIEGLGELAGDRAVVARVHARGGTLVGEPLSVLSTEEGQRIDVLHFDAGPPVPSGKQRLVERLRRAALPPRVEPPDDEPGARVAPTRLPTALVDLRHLVEQRAQRGVGGLAPGVLAAELEGVDARLRAQGFPVFRETVVAEDAELVLRHHYLLQQVERVLA
jgi:hypothetical protein